jgi:dienelactone hydrolase
MIDSTLTMTILRTLGLLIITSCVTGQNVLPGTSPLTLEGDPASKMVDSINDFLVRETAAAAKRRHPDPASTSRERLRTIIGAVDPRVPFTAISITPVSLRQPEIARGKGYKVYEVRWPVFDGVDAEGLLLQPDEHPLARIVAIPDADWTPEMIAGLAPGGSAFARRLVEKRCEVLVPVLIDRADTWSGIPGIRMTNQPHREWIYRMAFEVGRHIIGYEVQKVLAAVDWFERENSAKRVPIAVAGYGEGGLIALYSGSLDRRIGAALISGYFQPREGLAREPIYRDVWGLLRGFGDAELAALIVPRALTVEACRLPPVNGPPPATQERRGAAPVGALATPTLEEVRREFERARQAFSAGGAGGKIRFVSSGEAGAGPPGSETALQTFLDSLGIPGAGSPHAGDAARDLRTNFDPAVRLRRQFDQLVAHTQALIATSGQRRKDFWSRADPSSPETWKKTTASLRAYVWEEVIGRLPDPSVPPNPRTRLMFDEPKFRGYEVMLDVWPGIFAYGILLVPKDIRPGERRGVVVCQHGLEGRPGDVADPKIDSPYYHRFAVRLAEEGFVTFAPQNPYIGEDRFRQIQRRAHPLKLSLFSFILGQHQRILEWLGGLAFADPTRIGFYGLSYGGKTAVRVPPLLDGYALSICSADFNEWVWKTTSVRAQYSYMLTGEYDMLEFNFANVVNYSDLANLMAPRPFMVERGHDDGVAPDEWVAYEYAKVRRFYTKMGIGDRTAIEFFNGPHTIHGAGTFEFLRRHLRGPQ